MLKENTIRDLENARDALERAISKAEKRLEKSPTDRLTYRKSPNGLYFYSSVSPETKIKTYLGKKKMNIASAIAQRDYDARFIKCGRQYLKKITDMLAFIERKNIDDVYENLVTARKNIVVPAIKTSEMLANDFEKLQYEPKPFLNESPVFTTDNGERVRSKSEILIANSLHKNGIMYKYERPIMVNGALLHPDFTVWNASNRKPVIWEHFGMMDDISYSREAVRRIGNYESAGYVAGEDVIYTFETSQSPISTSMIEHMISTYCR